MSGLVFNILVCKFLILEIRIFQLVLIFVNESSVMSLKFLTQNQMFERWSRWFCSVFEKPEITSAWNYFMRNCFQGFHTLFETPSNSVPFRMRTFFQTCNFLGVHSDVCSNSTCFSNDVYPSEFNELSNKYTTGPLLQRLYREREEPNVQ